mgnify:CR=1 FL=1
MTQKKILNKTDRKLLMKEVFNHFGSQNKTAAALKIDKASVSLWVKLGEIPSRRAIQIERMTDRKFDALLMAGKVR